MTHSQGATSRPTILVAAPVVAPPHGGLAAAAESIVESVSTFATVRLIARSEHPRVAADRRVLRKAKPGMGEFLRRQHFKLEVVREARAQDVAAVHALTWRVGAPVLPVLGGRVLVVHCLGAELLRVNRLSRMVRDRVFARADLILAISGYTAEVLQAETGRRAEVLHLGVHPPTDARTKIVRPGSRSRILSVARFVPRKGHLDLVRTVAKIRKGGCDCSLVIAGGMGPELPKVLALRDELHAQEWIRLEIDLSRDRIAELYAEADIFAMLTTSAPREFEGFGLVFVEAALAGVPIVAGTSGGSRDAVADGVSGFLVRSPEEAEAKLRLLCSDARLRREMGEGGRLFGRKFLHSEIDKRVAALYAGAWRRGRHE